MTAPPESAPEPLSSRICLAGSAGELARAGDGEIPVAAHPSVSVMIARAPETAEDTAALSLARAVADRHDLAFIVENDVDLALDSRADGVQIEWQAEAYSRARTKLGPERTIGCLTPPSRHEAMTAAEAGADYIGLNVATAPECTLEQAAEFISWWTGLFEVPFVAQGATDPETVAQLKEARPEFISLPPRLWTVEVLNQFSA